jgi:indolepyruvate decarboxylase
MSADKKTPYTVASYLTARLIEIGIEHVFTIPGDYCAPFLDVLDATPGIERVPNINELGCGYAADGYARMKGAGAACVQYGVGTFSLLNCVAGSYVEFAPVAIISSSPNASSRLLEEHQNILFHHSTGDLRADQKVFEQVTVASVVITNAGAAPSEIDSALTAMLTERRPVYIEVINNVWTQACTEPAEKLQRVRAYSDPKSLAAAVAAAAQMVRGAASPVFFFGVELQRFGLQADAQRLVDLTRIPFTTTSLAKTMLDEMQPLFAGTYAGPASPPRTNELVTSSDCVIALGTIITDDYLGLMASSFGNMIRVSRGETRVGLNYFPTVELADFLPAFHAALHKHPVPQRPYPPDPPYATLLPIPEPGTKLTYETFYETLGSFVLREPLRNESVLILGESTSLYVFGNLFGLPPDSFVGQAAWGSLGHETGSALGVGLGTGKRPLVVAGDGGFMMVCQEVSSLARARSNAVVFVMSNQGYAIEQAFVNLNAFEPGGEFAPYDILPRWDYMALAQAFGARGVRVTTTTELRDFLQTLSNPSQGPALVEVVIPQHDLAPQLRRLAEPPPTLLRYRRAESSIPAVGNPGLL